MLSELLLNCGDRDTDVLEEIDEEILEEAVKEIKDEGLELNFPNLYFECARIALDKAEILEEQAEIDCNYMCAHISLSKVSEKKAEELEKLGFTIYCQKGVRDMRVKKVETPKEIFKVTIETDDGEEEIIWATRCFEPEICWEVSYENNIDWVDPEIEGMIINAIEKRAKR